MVILTARFYLYIRPSGLKCFAGHATPAMAGLTTNLRISCSLGRPHPERRLAHNILFYLYERTVKSILARRIRIPTSNRLTDIRRNRSPLVSRESVESGASATLYQESGSSVLCAFIDMQTYNVRIDFMKSSGCASLKNTASSLVCFFLLVFALLLSPNTVWAQSDAGANDPRVSKLYG